MYTYDTGTTRHFVQGVQTADDTYHSTDTHTAN